MNNYIAVSGKTKTLVVAKKQHPGIPVYDNGYGSYMTEAEFKKIETQRRVLSLLIECMAS